MCPLGEGGGGQQQNKTGDTFSNRVQFSSSERLGGGGVNIYLQFLVKEEKRVILMPPPSIGSDYRALVFDLFGVRGLHAGLIIAS